MKIESEVITQCIRTAGKADRWYQFRRSFKTSDFIISQLFRILRYLVFGIQGESGGVWDFLRSRVSKVFDNSVLFRYPILSYLQLFCDEFLIQLCFAAERDDLKPFQIIRRTRGFSIRGIRRRWAIESISLPELSMNKAHLSLLLLLLFLLFSKFLPSFAQAELCLWANDGGDKVTKDELRCYKDASKVINTVWDGSKINVFGARNEVVSFNLILEAPSAAANDVAVSFNRLIGPNGSEIVSKTVSGNGVFDWVGRSIELFYVRYLEIKGLSLLSYGFYDERHVPERFRRPWTGEGDATGTWEDRPDHNKLYPDIAVPLELIGSFNIPANQNQSIWVDIYIPNSAQAGTYRGTLSVGSTGGHGPGDPR